MKVNLDWNFKGLDGKDLQGDTAAKLVANMLSNKAEGIAPIKAYDWAIKLFNEGELEVDETDFEALQRVIEASDFVVLAKAQVLKNLKAAKEG